MDLAELRAKIRDIKDFPTEGILFKDITTLLRDGPAWASVIDHLAARYDTSRVDLVVGVESRGFIAVPPGQRVLVVDDLLATGGTMAATLRLIERLGGMVVGTAFLIELAFLKGRERLPGQRIDSLIVYE
jgi:adenine phosphoribosyltransferase